MSTGRPAADCVRRTAIGASRDRPAPVRWRDRVPRLCAGDSDHPAAARFWRNCSSFRAPMMTLEMVGRCSSQFSATWATLFSVSLATCSSASTTLYKCSSGYLGSLVAGLVQATASGQGLAAANLARQTAPPQRTPDQRANSLVERERHEFPFVLPANAANSRPGAPRSGTSHSGRKRPAISSSASRRNLSRRCSALFRSATSWLSVLRTSSTGVSASNP